MPEELKQALKQEQDTPEPADNGGTEPEPPQAQGEPLDPNIYDDGGVPWKNRAMEANRKLQEEADKRAYAEQMLQQRQTNQPQPQQPQQQQTQDPYEQLNYATDQVDFAKRMEKIVMQKVEERYTERERQRSISNAVSKHPDLRNANSEFYRAVDRQIWELKQITPDIEKSPYLVEKVADMVARQRGGNGTPAQPAQTPPSQPPNRLPTIGQTPSRPVAPKPAQPELRGTFKNGLDLVSDDFTADEMKKVQERLRNRDAKGEFELGV